ncbi:hypothetical protein QTV49_005078 [Vibrio vulnificus]|nr:hypothetical protein [Vibrio vulnificus]
MTNSISSTSKIDTEQILKAINQREEAKYAARDLFASFPLQPAMPSYKPFESGEWRLESKDKETSLAKDYFGIPVSSPTRTLQKISGSDIGLWMSITAMELQSHTIHINSLVNIAETKWLEEGEPARIVIGGLGMGMYLVNCLHYLYERQIPANIHVIELSKDVSTILENSLDGYCHDLFTYSMEGYFSQEVDIIIGNILEIEPIEDVDYMYVDIWQNLASDKALPNSRQLVEKWKPKKYGYWCEEFDVAIHGNKIAEELNLAQAYDNEKITKACEVIFEANAEIPVAAVKAMGKI